MKPIDENLIDKLWEEKSAASKEAVFVYEEKYSGECSEIRLKKIVDILRSKGCSCGVIATLDQIAWILNLRGFDIDFNPYFMGYFTIILGRSKAKYNLYADEDKFKDKKVQDYLAKIGVKLLPYEKIIEDLTKIDKEIVGIELGSVNAKILGLVRAKDNIIMNLGDKIPCLKQKKNPVELEGFRQCHVRDGLGLVKHLAWLEHQLTVLNRTDIDEFMASENVFECRKTQDKFMRLSFKTISAFGPNASVIHYKPAKETAMKMSKDQIYLVDSGAHYLYFFCKSIGMEQQM
jgi:Xaa-Pro aminopeptidase